MVKRTKNATEHGTLESIEALGRLPVSNKNTNQAVRRAMRRGFPPEKIVEGLPHDISYYMQLDRYCGIEEFHRLCDNIACLENDPDAMRSYANNCKDDVGDILAISLLLGPHRMLTAAPAINASFNLNTSAILVTDRDSHPFSHHLGSSEEEKYPHFIWIQKPHTRELMNRHDCNNIKGTVEAIFTPWLWGLYPVHEPRCCVRPENIGYFDDSFFEVDGKGRVFRWERDPKKQHDPLNHSDLIAESKKMAGQVGDDGTFTVEKRDGGQCIFGSQFCDYRQDLGLIRDLPMWRAAQVWLMRFLVGIPLLAWQAPRLWRNYNSVLSSFSSALAKKEKELMEAQAQLVHQEKMAGLGVLSAGVAHEINNPIAAIYSNLNNMRDSSARDLWREVRKLELAPDDLRELLDLREISIARCSAEDNRSRIEIMKQQMELQKKLAGSGIDSNLAGSFAEIGLDSEHIDRLVNLIIRCDNSVVGEAICEEYRRRKLVENSLPPAKKISDIVTALTHYSHLDREPIGSLDLNRSLDETLVIMGNKLKKDIEVEKTIR